MEKLKRDNKLSNVSIESYVDQSLDVDLLKESLPSPELISNALSNNNYNLLENLIIIPSSNYKKSIKFSDDIWTNKEMVNEGEGYRRANFNKLPLKIKNEIKIIGLYLFWFSIRKAKVSSIIRIIENLIVISRFISDMNVKSIFYLDHEPIRKRFIEEFSHGKATGTIDNYFKSLSRICDIQHTFLKKHSFYLKTNFINYSPNRKVNQTYCMPIEILLSYWRSYIDYFDNLNIVSENWEYISNLNYKYRLYLKDKNLKHHNNNWLFFIDEFCQDRLQEIYNSKKCVTRNLITKRSDENIESYNNKSYKYKKNINGEIKEVSLSSYNRRYPKYIIDIDDIFLFYNRNALIACEAIQSMTGMRKSESLSIKFDSIIDDNDWIGIKSTHYKHADEGGVEEIWAAAPYVKKIFKIMRKIASSIFRLPDKKLGPLYIKTNAREFYSSGKFSLMMNQRTTERQLNWSNDNKIYITKDDVTEFWQINPNIHDKAKVERLIYVGATWPVESHQFRRSIAVHVRRLELVTMNQLSSHFKHLARMITEWYSDGSLVNNSFRGKLAEAFAKELEKAELERAATLAIKFQNGEKLYGKGGKTLESQKNSNVTLKTYRSFEHAKSLARRKKAKLMSLGNGMYCMNGTECEFKPIVQTSVCRLDCENLVADSDSIPIWLNRYKKFRKLYLSSMEENQPVASQEFLRLEMESYKQALEFYGVIL